MLALHEVTKTVGRGRRAKTVLDSVSWQIERRAKIAILAHPGSGKTILLGILAGTQLPTKGWVERRASVSPMGSFTRQASGLMTPRQLIDLLAPFLHYDPSQMCQFVHEFAELGPAMDVPVRYLVPKVTQALNLALFYGVPSDYYLFDQRITLGPRDLQPRALEAFSQRSEHAGVILTTSLAKEARNLGGSGAILHRGKISFFEDVEDAIEVFSAIPPDVQSTPIRRFVEEPADDPELDY
jgi:capsular polysaccharide transport system ATP-binding protein